MGGRCKDPLYHKKYYQLHKGAQLTAAKARYFVRKGAIKARRLLTRYGLTADAYSGLAQQQQNKCAICLQNRHVRGKPALNVDHNHKTGKVRGLLCSRCNSGLASFEDNPIWLVAAIAYLNKSDT